MPWGLKRYQNTKQSHFVTFCCYHRKPLLVADAARRIFESALERIRRKFRMRVYGYVVMPEHVHLLVSEPEHATLADALKSLKQGVSRRLIGDQNVIYQRVGNQNVESGPPKPDVGLSGEFVNHFWQKRYYDFNVRNHDQFVQKLRYIHRNPVKAGLCERPEDWGMEQLQPLRHGLCRTRGD